MVLLIQLLAVAAPHVLFSVRSEILAAGSHDVAALTSAISKLKAAEQSCSADAEGTGDAGALAEVRSGYESISELLQFEPGDLAKYKKAKEKAQKKYSAVQAEVNDDDEELVSKAEKAEKAAKLSKAQAAVAEAEKAVAKAEAASVARERRTILMGGLAESIARRIAPSLPSLLEEPDTKKLEKPLRVMAGAALQVLSIDPLVVTLDDWLGPTGLRALDGAAAALEAALDPPEDVPTNAARADRSRPDPPQGAVRLPMNASALGEQSSYARPMPQLPMLCLPIGGDGQPDEALLSVVASEIAKAKAAKAKGMEHCDATAGLLDEQPDTWDPAQDGAWAGTYNKPADRFGNTSSGCGPLTPALDAALVSSDAVTFTASASAYVDILDAAVSEVLGFTLDAEQLGAEILEGLTERFDPSAKQPLDWNADEDGTWEAPMLPKSTPPELWAAVIRRGGDNASGLADAYAFSSSPIIVRSRAGKGAEGMHHDCASVGASSVTALLHLSDTLENGGETTLPALDLTVPAVRGRLLLVETILPDGACDPATGRGARPLPMGAPHKLTLVKTFFADRSFSRERVQHEGPQRGVPTVDCAARQGRLGCRRFEHVPATKGDTVLPLRQLKKQRSCLTASAAGACIDENYTPPPPQKKSKKNRPLSTPPTTPPPPEVPRMPGAPLAPPPVAR